MQIDFLTVLIAVLSLIILAVPGFILVKTKLLNNKVESALSTIVLYGAQPVMVFMGFQSAKFDPNIGVNVLIVAGITILIHVLMAVLLSVFIKGKNNEQKKRVVRYASMFSNCGFMGFPFLQIVFANSPSLGEVMIYASVVVAIFNIMNWTIGVYLISDDLKNVSLKKIITNPTIIAVVLGFILFFTIKVPLASLPAENTTLSTIVSRFMDSLDIIGNMVTPLSMTVIGIKLANANLKEIFLDAYGYLTCANKLIGMSILTMILVCFLPINELVKYVLVFLLSMPCATSTALFTTLYGGDGKSATAFVLLSSIVSILTIPLMFLLFSALL